MAERITRVSVRTMVEFVLREEDLQPGGSDTARMLEGSTAHRARQREAAEVQEAYESEVSLSLDGTYEGFPLRVGGRADGVYRREGSWVVEEIKLSYTQRMQEEAVHMAQCACYGHILCKTRSLPSVVLCVLYVDRDGGEISRFETEKSAEELEEIFQYYAGAYAQYAAREQAHRSARDVSIAAASFPHAAYREGQRTLSANVYVAVRERKRLLAQAPTGTGKTAAVLFPAIKALGQGLTRQIFYLTARTTGRALAFHTLNKIDAELRIVELTAKDKICPQEERRCMPESCPYAKGFFLRLPAAIEEAWQAKRLPRDEIEAIARRHSVCPFELSLILCDMADVVVCDYNYVFDPFVHLKAITPSAKITLLIDEAHNLPDRVRDMLSADLDERRLVLWRRAWGKQHGRSGLYAQLTAMIRIMEKDEKQEAALCALGEAAGVLADGAAQALSQGKAGSVDIFLAARAFAFCAARRDETYAVLTDDAPKAHRVRLFCMDGADHIAEATRKLRGTVFFSATLSPAAAFRRLLGAQEGDVALTLPSPFAKENLCVMRLEADTRYGARSRTAADIAQALAALCRAHAGNYLFLFSSYAYLAQLRDAFEALDVPAQVLCERAGMTEEERDAFLQQFEAGAPPQGSRIGFCVMGGVFAEGIDLPGERLCGVAVIGVGLPMLCAERDALRDYHNARAEDGFHLAYRVPGMIRVLQAAGRVIRKASDRGTLLLIDARFFTQEYVDLMPAHFSHICNCANAAQVQQAASDFYRQWDEKGS